MNLPWKYISVSLLIGILLGAAGGILTAHYVRPRWMRPSPEKMVQRFNRKLQLTDTQRTQIHAILSTHREKMRTHRQEARQSVQTEIRKILTPEQIAQYDAMEKKREERQR